MLVSGRCAARRPLEVDNNSSDASDSAICGRSNAQRGNKLPDLRVQICRITHKASRTGQRQSGCRRRVERDEFSERSVLVRCESAVLALQRPLHSADLHPKSLLCSVLLTGNCLGAVGSPYVHKRPELVDGDRRGVLLGYGKRGFWVEPVSETIRFRPNLKPLECRTDSGDLRG